LDYNYEILNLERQYERYKKLFNVGDVTEDEFERARDSLNKAKEKRELLKEEIREDEILGEKQIEHAENSIKRGNRSLDLLSKVLESLDVTASISGTISSINVEIGQRIGSGFRIGQIDRLDEFKVRAGIDQYYLPKVDVGTEGTFSFDGDSYTLAVNRIYPEIDANSEFTVDMLFKGETPEGIRRGQVLTISLRLGDPVEGLLVKLGGFQQAGGRWIYLISEDRTRAFRQPIRQGIKNPRYVEIIEGLKEGDWVITSGYDTFKEADELIFKTPLSLDKIKR
jgi:HlyD family secretion protein